MSQRFERLDDESAFRKFEAGLFQGSVIENTALILPLGNSLRIAVVIGECLVYGLLNGIINIYQLQCLARGTTELGRARALKLTFGFGPIAAVAGSLGTQFVLKGGIPGLAFPLGLRPDPRLGPAGRRHRRLVLQPV